MKISVVCPFYNESAIIEKATLEMIQHLEMLSPSWELILVNDGSLDDGFLKLSNLIQKHPKKLDIHVLTYEQNRGRGHALQTGIHAAKGDFIITTEIDLSWGNDIVSKIFDYFQKNPKIDIVVASPNIPGGGYKNVPLSRVVVSRFGNILIRSLFPVNISMNTGMTRGYKREVIQSLTFEEPGKEFHLETLLKLSILGYSIGEVPAILEWKESKLLSPGSVRKSSTKVSKIAWSHLNFVIFANPIRYFWGIGILSAIASTLFVALSFRALYLGHVAIFYLIVSFFLGLFSLLFFSFGVVTAQNSKILKELWKK